MDYILERGKAHTFYTCLSVLLLPLIILIMVIIIIIIINIIGCITIRGVIFSSNQLFKALPTERNSFVIIIIMV